MDNNENTENIIIPCENQEQNEKDRISCENQRHYEKLIIPTNK